MANLIPSLVQASQYQQEAAHRGAEDISNFFKEKRIKDMGQRFISSGDYSPEGIQAFAKDNKITPREMVGIVSMAAAFENYKRERDPLVQVKTTDDEGNSFVQSVPISQTIGQKFQTGVAEKEAYFNPGTKETRLYPKGNAPDTGFYPVSTANAMLNRQAQRADVEYREGQQNERARLGRENRNTGGGKDETINQKIAKSNFLAQSLGWSEGGYDKNGNMLPDKVTYYQNMMANGTKDQQKRAKAGLALEYDIAGVEMPPPQQKAPEAQAAPPETGRPGIVLAKQLEYVQSLRPGTTWADIQETANKYNIPETEVLRKIMTTQAK